MAHYQNPYGDTTRTGTDEYGNPVRHTDQYGNPVHQTGSANPYGATGAAGAGYGNTTATGMTGHHGTGHQGLHRSGSSSSSSSEDEVDENGVRRKKGMKDKIKEKIPGMGGHHQDKPHATATTTPTPGGYGAAGEQHHEKKGIMDKIKEKLPGQH